MVLHVKGLEATTSVEEVQKAIKDVAGIEEGDLRTGTLRPAFGGTQNITVTMSREMGQKLLERSSLQIGWATCRVNERIEIRCCLKCWRAGHQARTCKSGEDRTNCCLRCGTPGHKVKDCSNQPFCSICEKEGHRADAADAKRKERVHRKESKTVVSDCKEGKRDQNE